MSKLKQGSFVVLIVILAHLTFSVSASTYSYNAILDWRVVFSSAGNSFIGAAAGTWLNGDIYKTVTIADLTGLPADSIITGGTLNYGLGTCATTDNYEIGVYRAIAPNMINHTFSSYSVAAADSLYSSIPLGTGHIFDGSISLNAIELTNLKFDNRGFIIRSLDTIAGHYCPLTWITMSIAYDLPTPTSNTVITTESFYWQASCSYGTGQDCLSDPQQGSYDLNLSIATLSPVWANIPAVLISATLEFTYTPLSALDQPYITVGSVLHGTDIAWRAVTTGLNVIPLAVTGLRSANTIYISQAGYRVVGSLLPYAPNQNYKLTITYATVSETPTTPPTEITPISTLTNTPTMTPSEVFTATLTPSLVPTISPTSTPLPPTNTLIPPTPTATATNTPPQDIQLIVNVVMSYNNLNGGIVNSLDQKLQNAMDALNALNGGNSGSAINRLEAFINEVQAQRNNKITPEQADALITMAQNVIARLTAGY